jgi:hypothetical protein
LRVRTDDTDDQHGTDNHDLRAGAGNDDHHHEDAAIHSVMAIARL